MNVQSVEYGNEAVTKFMRTRLAPFQGLDSPKKSRKNYEKQ